MASDFVVPYIMLLPDTVVTRFFPAESITHESSSLCIAKVERKEVKFTLSSALKPLIVRLNSERSSLPAAGSFVSSVCMSVVTALKSAFRLCVASSHV